MGSVKIAFSLVATAALVACGGGGGGSAETAATPVSNPTVPNAPGVPAADTAAVCFNPLLLVTGTTFKTVTRATYPGHGTMEQVSTMRVDGLSIFNGSEFIKTSEGQTDTPDAALLALGQRGGSSSAARYFTVDSSTGSIRVRAFEISKGVTPAEQIDVTTTNNPSIETRLSLKAGQSFDQSYTQTSRVTRSSGTTLAPIANYKKNVLFVGVATVTVPAGTFQACQFVETGTVSYSGSPGEASTGIATIWTGVGSGLPIKTVVKHDAAGTGTTSTFELLSATINGAVVTPQ